MKIGFDIGGVLSKYPDEFNKLLESLMDSDYYSHEIYIISDMHPVDKIVENLSNNSKKYPCFGWLANNPTQIYSANYEKHGNIAKAILIKDLGIQIFFDDFDGYLQWDSSLGPQPILLKVQPDMFRPYWAKEWKVKDGSDFGRRVATPV